MQASPQAQTPQPRCVASNSADCTATCRASRCVDCSRARSCAWRRRSGRARGFGDCGKRCGAELRAAVADFSRGAGASRDPDAAGKRRSFVRRSFENGECAARSDFHYAARFFDGACGNGARLFPAAAAWLWNNIRFERASNGTDSLGHRAARLPGSKPETGRINSDSDGATIPGIAGNTGGSGSAAIAN